MVKRWLSTFAEQPSPAALQVVAEDLGERMRCSHDLGRQRGGVLRIGGCGSRTGADADRVQRASISSAHAGRSDHIGTWRHWSCSARRRRRPAPAGPAKQRNIDLLTEKSFLHAVSTGTDSRAVSLSPSRSRGTASRPGASGGTFIRHGPPTVPFMY